MKTTGATLISDGWTNVQNRPMIKCLLVTGDGAMFVDGVNTSGQIKDAKVFSCFFMFSIKIVENMLFHVFYFHTHVFTSMIKSLNTLKNVYQIPL